MKNITIFCCLIMMGGCSTKKATVPAADIGNIKVAALPACINKMIEEFAAAEKENPPRKIYSYSYKGKTVYYVTPPCCDFFSDLYDAECKLMGHPDGGITGKGDGKFADFETAKSNEQLVWQDKR